MTSYPNGLKTSPTVSDPFGPRINPVTGVQGFHYGVDSHSHPGGLNCAPEGGAVVFAASNYGAGLEVRIDVPGTNRQWRMKHHASFLVTVGQTIGEATPTGPTGTTGQSTGIHCHTELHIGGVRVDPWPFIASAIQAENQPGNQEEDDHMLYYKDGETNILYARDTNVDGPQLAIVGKDPSTSVGFTIGKLNPADIRVITGPQTTQLIVMYGVKPVSEPAFIVWSGNRPAVKGLSK